MQAKLKSVLNLSCSLKVLQGLGSDQLLILLTTLFLQSFTPTNALLPSTFSKLSGMTLPFTLTLTVLLQKNTRLLPLLLLSSPTLNAAKSSIPFGRIKHHPKAWWSAEVEEGVSERRKAFAAAHKSDEDRQAYIAASRHASSVIAKAEAWQATCSSLSPKCNSKSVYSLLRFVAFSSSSSPNFPNGPFPGSRLRSTLIT